MTSRRVGFVALTASCLVAAALCGMLAGLATYAAIRHAQANDSMWTAATAAVLFALLAMTFAFIALTGARGMTSGPEWQYHLPKAVKILGLVDVVGLIALTIVAATAGGGFVT